MLVVKELAKCASLELSGLEDHVPDPDAFRVRDLIVELDLHPILRTPGDHDADMVQRAWTQLIGEIKSHLSQSTTVVIRGWTPALSLRFSKPFMALHFGNLGQRCQWVDGILVAANRESSDTIPVHRTTTLNAFIDEVDNPSTCGNFLDGKDTTPSVPAWAAPLLDSTSAWNHTMHLRFTQKPKKKKVPKVTVEESGPTSIRAATWTSQGWRLVTHPGYVTFPHHDCCGMATYVIANVGAKVWAVMRPKRTLCPDSLEGLSEVFHRAITLSREGTFSEADVATVCLEEGDVM